MATAENWMNDIPQQFHGKANIEVIISAFAKQIDEFLVAMAEVNNLTQLSTALGKNLDRIGNILSLSRKDATNIIKKQRNTALTDELYRKCLQYQMIKMTTECTYENIIDAIGLLWDTTNFTYSEPEDRPATILLELPEVDVDQPDPSIGNVLIPKAAGVSAYYTTGNHLEFQIEEFFKFIKLEMHLEVPSFYSRHLDGAFLLDGSELLNGGMVFQLPINIKYGGIQARWDENAELANIILLLSALITENSTLQAMNIRVTQNLVEDAILKLMAHFILVNSDEQVDNVVLRTAHDEWYLDGTYTLDGGRNLDAWVTEEVI